VPIACQLCGTSQPRSNGSDHGDVKLIEISEDRPPGQMLDLIYVAEAKLKLVTKYSA
jgi:hypothetical protein